PSVYLDGKGEQLRVELIIYFHHKKEAKEAKQLLTREKEDFLQVLNNLPERFSGMMRDFSSVNMEEVFNEFIQSNYSSFSIFSDYDWEESIISSSNLENRIFDDLNSLLPVMNYWIKTVNKLKKTVIGIPEPGLGGPVMENINFNIKHILDYFAKSEYTYDPELVQRLHIGLHATRRKHFVILTGISGTGKTNIVKLYANSVYTLPIKETNDYLRIIPVRPDWNDEKSLLGYYNPLLKRYEKTAFLEFILEAGQSNLPYFICLDEMNLARVEYYFSDFLSALESGYPIRLHDQTEELDGVPPELTLPDNLFIIGTVNVDETTHTISDKVLDRASTLEFNEVDVDGFLQKSEGAAQNQQGAYLLKNVYSILAKNHLHFGYRTMKEFFDALVFNQKQEAPMDEIRLLDALVLQKILPKIRGDHRIEILLQELIDFLSINLSKEARSVSRLKHMLEELRLFGATQFWR
ncbi:MAG TPA: hypothetical protein DDY49_00165, partial [Paenibacillaceae bacterium]|nr:hypothetical protein [Paenibacillaceae bacterium]